MANLEVLDQVAHQLCDEDWSSQWLILYALNALNQQLEIFENKNLESGI